MADRKKPLWHLPHQEDRFNFCVIQAKMPFSEFVYLFIGYFVYCHRQICIATTLRVVPIYKISEQIAPLICFGYHLLMFKFTLRWLNTHWSGFPFDMYLDDIQGQVGWGIWILLTCESRPAGQTIEVQRSQATATSEMVAHCYAIFLCSLGVIIINNCQRSIQRLSIWATN